MYSLEKILKKAKAFENIEDAFAALLRDVITEEYFKDEVIKFLEQYYLSLDKE